MGMDKASLVINGKMLIEIVTDNLLTAGISEITVSARDEKQSEWIKEIFNNKIQTVVDSEELNGIWDVLKFTLPTNNMVQIISVDSPWFDAQAIQLLTKEFERNPTKIGVVPWSKKGPEPLLMQIKSSEFLENISKTKPMPLRKFVDSENYVKINYEKFSNKNALKNLNNPDDLIF